MIELKNNAGSFLSVSITAEDTQVQILAADASEFPQLHYPGDVFHARIRSTAGNFEYVRATAVDGNMLTLERGREGTTAKDFPAGSSFELMVTADTWSELAASRWVRPKDGVGQVLFPTRVDTESFSVPGDVTADFATNRAVHLVQAVPAYGYVGSSAYANGVTTITVQNCTVDAGLALVELGLEVFASPKYGNAANADTLEGKTKAQIVEEARAGTSANALDSERLQGRTEAEIVAAARSGLLPANGDGSQLTGLAAAQISGLQTLPAGAVIFRASSTVPAGYLECNGAAVSRTAYADLFAVIGTAHGYGDASSTFNLPDLRGRFVRGWDHAIARDPDRATRTAAATGGATGDAVGSVQADQYKSHTHARGRATGATDGGIAGLSMGSAVSGAYASTASGGSETRPVNINLMACIKY